LDVLIRRTGTGAVARRLRAGVACVSLLLFAAGAGCSGSSGVPADGGSGSAGGASGGVSGEAGDQGTAGEGPVVDADDVPQSTKDYLSCLQQQGIEATIGPFGEIMFFTVGDGESDSITSEEAPSGAQAEAEAVCAERVPDYAPPNLDTR
jgi:hypothetical protein